MHRMDDGFSPVHGTSHDEFNAALAQFKYYTWLASDIRQECEQISHLKRLATSVDHRFKTKPKIIALDEKARSLSDEEWEIESVLRDLADHNSGPPAVVKQRQSIFIRELPTFIVKVKSEWSPRIAAIGHEHADLSTAFGDEVHSLITRLGLSAYWWNVLVAILFIVGTLLSIGGQWLEKKKKHSDDRVNAMKPRASL